MMIRRAYMDELKQAFSGRSKNLTVRTDIDNQVQTAYECLQKKQVFLSANPFIHSMPDARLIPLDTGWVREYGIIYRPDPEEAVRKYIDTAVEVYAKKAQF